MNDINLIKNYLSEQGTGLLALDIDETISNTILAWVTKMQEIFGNPEGLSAIDMVKKYKHSSNIPYWQEQEHLEWQQEQIHSNELQKDMPVIELSQETIAEINRIKKIGLYITVRPESVLNGTYDWLNKIIFLTFLF